MKLGQVLGSRGPSRAKRSPLEARVRILNRSRVQSISAATNFAFPNNLFNNPNCFSYPNHAGARAQDSQSPNPDSRPQPAALASLC